MKLMSQDHDDKCKCKIYSAGAAAGPSEVEANPGLKFDQVS